MSKGPEGQRELLAFLFLSVHDLHLAQALVAMFKGMRKQLK